MSKLSEYIELVRRGIPNLDKILESLTNEVKLKYKLLPQDEVDEIVRRRLICQSCPFNSLNAVTSKEYKDLNGVHYRTAREDVHCSICGCPLETRTASLESNCGIEYYNTYEQKNNKLPLKWEKYKHGKQ